MNRFRKAVARLLMRAAGELMHLGLRVLGDEAAPAEETPPQDPLTPAAREMIVGRPVYNSRPKPEAEVLEGSARARYRRARSARGFD